MRPDHGAVPRADAGFRNLVESLPEGVLVYRDGRILYINATLKQYLGIGEQELGGTTVEVLIRRFFAGTDADKGLARLREASGQAVLPPVERHLLSHEGQPLVAELTTLTATFDGEPAQVTLVRDLTQRRAFEARLALADRMATLGAIVSGLAHELNNPLAVLLGNLELLLERVPRLLDEVERSSAHPEQGWGELREHMSEASRSASSVRGVMADFRSLTTISEAAPRRLDLAACTRSALRLSAHQLRGAAHLQPTLAQPLPVMADEAPLVQAVVHLFLATAAHMAMDGGPPTALRVETHQSPVQMAELAVLAPTQRRLELIASGTRVPGQHTGLTLCGELLAPYGGTVCGLSESDWSGVVIRLPLAPREPQAAQPQPRTPSAPRGHVLVVDDDPLVANILQRVLAGEHRVTVETDSRAALQRIAEQFFDAVVTDVMMPDISGLALYDEIARTNPLQAERLIFITGGVWSEEADARLTAAGRLVLEKPFDIAMLRTEIGRLVDSSPARLAQVRDSPPVSARAEDLGPGTLVPVSKH